MDAPLIEKNHTDGVCPFCSHESPKMGRNPEKRHSSEGVERKDVPERKVRAYYHIHCNRNWEVPISLIRQDEAS